MGIYREKSLEKLSSPDQLDSRIRIIKPPAWMLLGAIGLVVFAFVVWGVLGDVNGVSPIEAFFG